MLVGCDSKSLLDAVSDMVESKRLPNCQYMRKVFRRHPETYKHGFAFSIGNRRFGNFLFLTISIRTICG